jgi:hypothetical protein
VDVDLVERFRELNEDLARLDTASLSDEQLEELLVGLHRERQKLCGQEARLTAGYDRRRAFASDGSKTAAARLARRTGARPAAVRAQVTLGRRLRLMPKVSAALAAGEITVEHARLLGRLAASDRPGVAAAFGDAEEMLVAQAKSLEFDDFVKVVRYWEQCADPDGAEDDAARQRESRRLHISQTLDGMFVLDALLDPVSGTIVATALRRIERRMFKADWAAAKETHGDGTRVEHLARNAAQRRVDALVDLAERAMAAPVGARLPRPLVTVHVGYETFAGRLCELENGTVIAPGQLLPLLSRAEVERVVFDGPDRIIQLGERTRFFTGGLRRVIEIRDRHCTFPGCDTSPEECDVDHIVPHADGGPTVQRNGRLRCPIHNRHAHTESREARHDGNTDRSRDTSPRPSPR